MNWFLVLLPVFTIVSGLVMYNFNGRHQMLKFDLVQFLYAFLFSPVLFVWMKSFLFVLLKNELDLKLSLNQLFIADTVFSVMFLYVFAFIVIHSLTKTINLNQERDPLADITEYIEYFHLWLSHVVIYLGAMVLICFISFTNLFFPLQLASNKEALFVICGLGILTGIFNFTGIWLYESPDHRFMRLMKLAFGFFFLIHAALYFGFDIPFSVNYSGFWFIFMIYITCTVMSLMAERRKPKEKDGVFQAIPYKLNPVKSRYYIENTLKWLHTALRKRN